MSGTEIPLSRKVAGNAAWSGTARLLAIAVNFITVPIYLHGLGVQQYGVYVLIQSLLGVTGILNLGVGDATIMYMAETLGRRRSGEATRYFRSGLLVQLSVGVLGFGFFVGVAPHLFRTLLRLDPELSLQIPRSLLWFGDAWMLRNIAAALYTVPIAHQRYDIAIAIREGATIAERLVGMAAILGGGDMVRIFQAQCAMQGLAVVSCAVADRWQMPGLSMIPLLDFAALRETVRVGAWQSITAVASELGYTLDRWLVGVIISTEAVGYYGAVLVVVTSLHGVLGSLCSVLFPTFTELYSRESRERATRIFVSATWFLTHVAALAYLPLFLCARPFLAIWLGPQTVSETTILLRVLTVAQVMMGPSILVIVFLAGVGKTQWNALMGSLALVLGFVSNGILITVFGPAGMGWSRIAQGLVWAVGLLLMRGRFFPEMRGTWYLSGVFGATASLLVLLILSLPLQGFLDKLRVDGFVDLGVLALACGLGALLWLMITDRLFPGAESRHIMLAKAVASMRSG